MPLFFSILLALPGATTVGGEAVLTASSEVAWSQLSDAPTGLGDGDDDTLGAMSCAAGQVPVYPSTGSVWTCGDDGDTTLSSAEVVAAVAAAASLDLDGTLSLAGVAVLTEASQVNWDKLDDVPADLADGDDDSLADLACDDGQTPQWDAGSGVWTCASVGGSSVGAVITTRCAWTGTAASTSGSCTPPSCPSSWADLGITGSVKTGLATYGATASNTSYSTATGYSERSCSHETEYRVLVTRCAWTGSSAGSTSSCTPTSCPSGWTSLGVTGDVNEGAATYGATVSNTSYSKSGGYSERTCVL